MSRLNIMVTFQAAYVKANQGGAMPVEHDNTKNPYTSPAMRAALNLYGLRNDESVCTAELRLDKEDLLPREIRLLLLRYRKGEEL